MKMPFGKFAGQEVDEVPKPYLEWLHGRDGLYGDLKQAVEEALGIRPTTPATSTDDVATLKSEVARLKAKVQCMETELAVLEGENRKLLQELAHEQRPQNDLELPPPDEEFTDRLKLLVRA